MAEGQGIQWGKMIKGAVKITAIVAVAIGVVTGVGLGLEQLAPQAAEGALGTAAKFGAAITAGVSGATEYVASALSGPINSVVDMFTGGDQSTGSGEKAVEEVKAEAKAPSSQAEAQATENAKNGGEVTAVEGVLSTDANTAIDKSVDVLTEVPEDGKSAIQTFSEGHKAAEDALVKAGLSGELEITQAEVDKVESSANALKGATTEAGAKLHANAMVDAFNGIDGDGLGHRIDGIISEIDEKLVGEGAESQAAKDLNAARSAVVGFAGSMDGLHDKVSDIASTVNAELGGNEIKTPEAPKAWAAVGAGGVALGAAKAVGRAQGQREVMGAFTQAEMDRRGTAARVLGQGV